MFNFINKIMARAYSILFNFIPPRISSKLKTTLQLRPDTRIGDWYMFENHTILRIYGFEKKKYLFPTLLTPRIYALEFIRQKLVVDIDNFAKHNNPTTLKLPYIIG